MCRTLNIPGGYHVNIGTLTTLQFLEGRPINLQPNNPHQPRSAQRHRTGVEDSGVVGFERAVLAAVCCEEKTCNGCTLFLLDNIHQV